jgi:hypothetical protein
MESILRDKPEKDSIFADPEIRGGVAVDPVVQAFFFCINVASTLW